ncbi:alpha-N-acetylglucosaminidase [Streptomyces sp. N35]|uniref:alpha-N-acetylglucosaminidase n=1 Tax=Streptomyces sp. N35 TaxID=2795730 RepID=UPI0018F5183C|nr:alpha-N-acetylglucosaminidase [Streptomyces sp. N35]
MDFSRRSALALGASALIAASASAAHAGPCTEPGAAAGARRRLLPPHARQGTFRRVPAPGGHDLIRVTGTTGDLLVEGTTPAVQLTGLHQYLRHIAHAHFSWNGAQPNLPDQLPAPDAPLEREANVPHRFAFNDTNEGYTGPYRGWEWWEHELDLLALHGYNEVLVTIGTDSVYHRVFQEFGYTDAEIRAWIPGPAHQPWWLLQNMSGFGGPVSTHLLEQRRELAGRITRRLRELGMTPVLPGYYGTVPAGFAERNPGAVTVPQGGWVGFTRPDWLDPRDPHFARIAETFYATQRELYGDSSMYKMDLLHEGGDPGDVPIGDATRAVERALRTAHPDAEWAILGWQHNPHQELIAAADTSRMLIVDGLSDRFPRITDREKDWAGTPYAFGSIWNFGGHTAMGANTPDWEALYHSWRTKEGSALRGIALMPEAADNNPAAFALFSDLAWTEGSVELRGWYEQWPLYRYGAADRHASAAWDILRRTAYGTTRADQWSEAHEGLFGARPDLAADNAASWSPTTLRYDVEEFARALPELLAVAPALRRGSAYRYDLMDVARQTVSHRSRLLLPEIRRAYEAGDSAEFASLTGQWFRWMELLEEVVATDTGHLLGRWIAEARAWGRDAQERDRLAYDATSLLTVWGHRQAADGGGLRDYANREWSGLIGGLYTLRWRTYFDELTAALSEGREPKPIDWYALEENWLRTHPAYPTKPSGDIVRIARKVARAVGA